MKPTDVFFCSREQRDEVQLEIFREMVAAGQPLGAVQALHYCLRSDLDAPRWVLESVCLLTIQVLMREKSDLKGRAKGLVARFRQDQVDYDRWVRVIGIREDQVALPDRVQELREYRDRECQPQLKNLEKHVEWYGDSLERACECASLMSEGNDYCGSPDTFKRSYLKVEKAFREGTACRYFFLDWDFLAEFNMKIDPTINPAAGLLPLYEL